MKKHLPSGADVIVWKVTGSLIALVLLFLALAGGIRPLPLAVLITFYSIAGILGLIVMTGLLARPVQYEVRDDSITIRRSSPFSSITIPKSSIKAIRHIELGSFKPAVASLPWVFGYVGRFRNSEIGSFSMFATNTKGEVVFIDAGEKYVISPGNSRRFVHDVSGKR